MLWRAGNAVSETAVSLSDAFRQTYPTSSEELKISPVQWGHSLLKDKQLIHVTWCPLVHFLASKLFPTFLKRFPSHNRQLAKTQSLGCMEGK